MSTAPLTPTEPSPGRLTDLLQEVRGRVRGYALLSGFCLLVIVAVAIYWTTTGLDTSWFALQTLELPRSFRVAVFGLIVAILVWVLFRDLIRPAIRRVSDIDLALLLERRFPSLQDRLITSVESTVRRPEETSVISERLLTRTASEAHSILASSEVSDVFDTQSVQRRGWIAGLCAVTIGVHAMISPGVVTRWWSAFIDCDEVYQLRTTDLNFTVLAEPGDREVAFQTDDAGQLTYLHPRASDLELLMTVPDGTSEAGGPWVVPERIRVDVLRNDGTSSRSYVTRSGDRSFRFILTRLQEDVRIEVLAGDFRTPKPLAIRSVRPPVIDQLTAVCRYPRYTGWNQQRGPNVEILSSELELPVGTEFHLQAVSSKPLQGLRLVSDLFEIQSSEQSTDVLFRDASGPAGPNLPSLLSDDQQSFRVGFRIVAPQTDVPAEDTVKQPDSVSGLSDAAFIDILPNTSLKVFLHDTDDVMTASPETLRISGIVDKPPVIDVRQTGVANAITRRAIIPVRGQITDDYGLASAEFQFLVDDETNWRRRAFRGGFRTGLTYELTEDGPDREYFAVQPLELSEGQTLAITVVASDECELPASQQSRAEPMVFRIVSNEELLSLMYSQELALRRRFEEVIAQVQRIEQDLVFHEDIARRVDSGEGTQQQKTSDISSLNRCVESAGNTLRRQKNELSAIADAFAEITEQLFNNSVSPIQQAEKMKSDILQPLRAVTGEPIDQADRSLSQLRVAVAGSKPSFDLLQPAETDVRNLIKQLNTILEEIRDMAEFHEALSDFQNLIEDQIRINEETKRQQIRNLGF